VNTTTPIFIVGCGYLGRRLGMRFNHYFASQPETAPHLYGLVRSTRHVQDLQSAGIEPIVLDLDKFTRKQLLPVWSRNSVLFYFAPPPAEGESDTRLHRFLTVLPEIPQCFIQISTTGVYGDTGGARVDESCPVNPHTSRAKRRMDAEHISRVWCTENNVRRVVLRVPAIYGPDRLPLERLRSGEPVICQEHAPIINRIHVDDLVEICFTAAMNTQISGIYNVSDGNSITMTEYLRSVARLAGIDEPREIPLDEAQLSFSPEYLSYLTESRRIDNSRLLREFGLQLRYSNIEQGILESLKASRKP